jgi:hypothetical protein
MSRRNTGGASRPSPLRRLLAVLWWSPAPKPPAAAPQAPAVLAKPDPAPQSAPATPAITPQLTPGGPGGDAPISEESQASFFQARPGVWDSHRMANQDLAERARQAMQRAGIGKRDPLAPVIALLSEMLLRHTQLAADQAAEVEWITHQQDAAMRQRLAEASAIIHENMCAANSAMTAAVVQVRSGADDAIRRQEHVRRTCEDTFRKAALEAMARWVSQRVWGDRLLVMTTMLCVLVVAAGIAFVYGKDQGREEVLATTKAGDNEFHALLVKDGLTVAIHWLNLMKWNRLEAMPPSCAPQLSATGDRMACTYVFWDEPPPNPPPAR